MKKTRIQCLCFTVGFMVGIVFQTVGIPAYGADENQVEHVDLRSFFGTDQATFVFHDLDRMTMTVFNSARAKLACSPCSTFKIPNSLIGIETGVIQDASHPYQWDGVRRAIPTWNRDQTMRTAFQNSVVWYYQRLAGQVGEERMREYLQKIEYGNQDISSGLTAFWLSASLRISAIEQVVFLEKLVRDRLPFSERTVGIVKEIMVLEQDGTTVFRGKTGSGTLPDGKPLGWFVGYVEKGGHCYLFAANQDTVPGTNGMMVRDTVKQILTAWDLMPEKR